MTRDLQRTVVGFSLTTLSVLLIGCAAGRGRPSIRSVSLPEEPGGDVAIEVTLADETSQPVDVSLEVSRDEQVWSTATTPGGTVLQGLETSPGGVKHVFTWDSLADLGFRISGDTWIKITATGAGGLVDIRQAKLARIENLLPASKRVRNYLIHFGTLDTAKIALAQTHDLVILQKVFARFALYPNSLFTTAIKCYQFRIESLLQSL